MDRCHKTDMAEIAGKVISVGIAVNVTIEGLDHKAPIKPAAAFYRDDPPCGTCRRPCLSGGCLLLNSGKDESLRVDFETYRMEALR